MRTDTKCQFNDRCSPRSLELSNAIRRVQEHVICETPAKHLFDELLKDIVSLTESEYGIIGAVTQNQEGKADLKTLATKGIVRNDETQAFYEANVPQGHDFFDWDTRLVTVVTTGKPVVSHELSDDGSHGNTRPEENTASNTFLAMPVCAGEHVVGLVGIADRPGGYDETFIEFLQPLIKTYGQIIERFQRDSRRQHEVEENENRLRKKRDLLRAIGRAQGHMIRNAQPQQLFNELLEDFLQITDSDYGFIGEIVSSPEGKPYLRSQALTNIAWNKETQAFYEANIETGMEFHNLETLFGRVMVTGEAVIANDPSNDPRRGGLPPGHPALNAFLGLPVYAGDTLKGMVGLANRPQGYDQRLIEFLQPLVRSYGQIIEAFHNDIERQRAEQALQTSHRTTQLLSSYISLTSGLSITEVALTTLNFLKLELGLEHATIALLKPDGGGFQHLGATHNEQYAFEFSGSLPARPNALSEIIMDPAPRYRPNIETESTHDGVYDNPVATGPRSDFLVPLWVEDRCLGALVIASNTPDGISQDARQFLPLIAPNLAQSLHNTALYKRLRDEKSKLHSAIQSREHAFQELQRFRAALDSSDDNIFLIDPHAMKFVDFNRAATEDMGYSRADLLTLGCPDIAVPETTRTDLREVYNDLIESGKDSERINAVHQRRDGSQFPVEVNLSVLRDNQEKPVIIAVARDVSKRKEAEKTIESQLRHLNIIERVSRISLKATTEEQLLEELLDEILTFYDCDRAYFIYPCEPEAPSFRVPLEKTKPAWPGAFALGVEVPINPDVSELFSTALRTRQPVVFDRNSHPPILSEQSRQRFSIRALMLTAITPKVGQPWLLGIHHCARTHTFTDDEIQIFAEIGQRITDSLSSLISLKNLHDSQHYNRMLFEQSPVGLALCTMDGRLVDVNPAFAAILGRTVDESQQLTYSEITPETYEAEEQRQLNDLTDSGRYGPYEKEYKHKDGHLVPVSLSSMILEKGGEKFIWSSIEDITERKRAEDKLRQAAVVVENTDEGIIVTDSSGKIVKANKAFTEITGYTEAEAVGKNARLLKSGSHDAAFYNNMWDTLRQTGRWQGELMDRRKNGELFPAWMTISAVYDDQNEIANYVSVFTDITSLKRSQEKVDFLAYHDPLTQLPNRLLLHDRLDHAIEHAEREGYRVAVMFLDLDHFKHINDSLGHPIGDELLKNVATHMDWLLRKEDTLARLGGDEFVVLLENVENPQDIAVLAQKLLDSFREPFVVKGHQLHLGLSMGISVYPQDGKDTATLIKNADVAMYRAKEEGRNNYQFYTSEFTTAAFERLTMESALRKTLENDELVLHYQPQFSLYSKKLIGAEALVRWDHPTLGLVCPEQFIPLAEDCGLITTIGEWVLRTACTQMKEWIALGLPLKRIAVNISGVQFKRGSIAKNISVILREIGLAAKYLEIELTESSLMQDKYGVIKELDVLKQQGVSIAIDDFGTGYSSLSHLKKLPVNKLKIDRSFVHDILMDPNDEAIARAVIALSKTMQLDVLAEGIETADQAALLAALECNEGQGYLFSPPISAEQFLQRYRT